MQETRRIHPTYFLMDFELPKERDQETLIDYVKREPNYDLAFCQAWGAFKLFKDEPVHRPYELLDIIDAIQEKALNHVSNFFRCRADEMHFGLGRSWNCDVEGLKALIFDIWINQIDLKMMIIDTETKPKWSFQNESLGVKFANKYILSKKKFVFIDNKSGNVTRKILAKNGSDRSETLVNIERDIVELYEDEKQWKNTGLNYTPFVLISKKNSLEKDKKARQIFEDYFKEIPKASSDEEKIRVIVKALRSLMLLHLYRDGNGRTLFILTNLLLYQNQLKLTQLKNMCLFEGFSIDRLVREVIEGQDRFEKHFSNEKELSTGLKEYKKAVLQIKQLKKKSSLSNSTKTSFKERDFNSLFRKLAKGKENIELLQFLIDHAAQLNIDLFSKGLRSGNALDVAIKYENKEAIVLLEKIGLVPTFRADLPDAP